MDAATSVAFAVLLYRITVTKLGNCEEGSVTSAIWDWGSSRTIPDFLGMPFRI